MKVNFYATLRQITGTKTVDVRMDEPLTVRQLVDQLIHEYPGLQPELLDSEGSLLRHIHILVNGRDYQWLDSGENSLIGETDQVNIFPSVGGG